MRWHPDVPDLPIKKPKQIETIEKMDPAMLNSLPGVEVTEMVEEAAHAVASAYKKENSNGSFDECVELVSVALKVTGSAIGTQVGNAMVASCDHVATQACRLLFPD